MVVLVLLSTRVAMAQTTATAAVSAESSAADSAFPDSASPDSAPTEQAAGAGDETPPPLAEPAPAEPAPLEPEPEVEPETLSSSETSDEPPPDLRPRGPFSRGRLSVGGGIGFFSTIGGTSSRTWLLLGIGAGYFVLDGLEVRGDAGFWIGDPFIVTLTPGIRYVFHMVPVVHPYVGTFYRHYFLSGGFSDTDSVGARLGANFMLNQMSYVGAGVVFEHFLDSNVFSNPDQIYPEITIALTF